MEDDYKTKNKYKIQKGGKKKTLNTRYKKKETEVPEGYRKIELTDAEMPKVYQDPKIKYNMPKPYIKNPEQYKSMERKRPKGSIIVPKDSSKIKEFNHGGEAVVQGVGIAIKGTGFKGVF